MLAGILEGGIPMKLRALVVGLAAMLVGCATVPKGAVLVKSDADVPTIQQSYAGTLSKLKIGMPLGDFQSLIPDAYVAGQSGTVTAYELDKVERYVTQSDMNRQNFWWGVGSPSAKAEKQVLWFYFYNNHLVKWGRPQDWPTPPELIIKQEGAGT